MMHIKEVIDTVDWADYFRAGDTPSVLYLLDPSHDPDDPTSSSWARRFVRPFGDRPRFWTGIDGGVDWDYQRPRQTWKNADAVLTARAATLLRERPAVYASLREKVRDLYGADFSYDARQAYRNQAQ